MNLIAAVSDPDLGGAARHYGAGIPLNKDGRLSISTALPLCGVKGSPSSEIERPPGS